MTLLRPSMLWLLVVVLALVVGYVVLQRRRRHFAVRFTNLDLLESVAPRRPGWRRHLPAAATGAALVASVVGLAQPVHAVDVARESAVVMLAIDVSASMAATDLEPDRLAAAVTAAADFVESLPEGFDVGLVSFDKSAKVVVQPTDDHDSVVAAIEQLQLGQGTAAGEGIVAALDAITAAQAAAGIVPVVAVDASTTTDDTTNDDTTNDDTTNDGTIPATIVLLSDGATTAGRSVTEAAQLAADAGVPVSTITYGTESGTVAVEGQIVAVPPDPLAMREVAEITGGTAFDASTTSELADVYSAIEAGVGSTTEQSSLMVWFLGAAMALVALAAVGSMVWTGRFL